MDGQSINRQRIAIVGTGISGLSAAWLLTQHHDVTVYERDTRVGGHSCTVPVQTDGGTIPVDMGFIVYNERTYPNLTALFSHLGVATQATEMSLAVSLDDGRLEYGGGTLGQLFAQKRNLVLPRYWAMLTELVRFYRQAPRDLEWLANEQLSLGDYLRRKRFGTAFVEDHLLAMAAAIWSVPRKDVLDFPAYAFIKFQENHGLLNLIDRSIWRTVTGGSQVYVRKLSDGFASKVRTEAGVKAINRTEDAVVVQDLTGQVESYDRIIIAAHADQALAMLKDPTTDESSLLGSFKYKKNVAFLHSDSSLMPKRRRAWSSWNYLGRSGDIQKSQLTVTYWMNRLQGISEDTRLFVTLNPDAEPKSNQILATQDFDHPVMNAASISAQNKLWSLQGKRRTWYCGAYFGAGFHEDGLQAGLAVAEAVGGVKRPWQVPDESGRITLGAGSAPDLAPAALGDRVT